MSDSALSADEYLKMLIDQKLTEKQEEQKTADGRVVCPKVSRAWVRPLSRSAHAAAVNHHHSEDEGEELIDWFTEWLITTALADGNGAVDADGWTRCTGPSLRESCGMQTPGVRTFYRV